MKNEMLALAVVAAACLAALPAAAVEYTDWFAGTASTKTNAEWDEEWPEGVEVDVESGKIVLSEDTSALKLTPTNAVPAINKTNVVVTSTAAFTTFDYEELANLHMSGSQISFVVAQDSGVTNYYGYAGSEWIKLTGKTPLDPETDTTFTVTVDYSARTVSFAVGDTTLSAADGGTNAFTLAAGCTHVADVTYSGIGTVTSIDADYQKAIASYANLGYITYADAIKAGGKVDTITDPDYPAGEQTAANGLPKWQCKALGLDVSDVNATIKPVPVAKDEATDGVTLQAALTPTEGELEVELLVKKGGDSVGGPYPTNAIKLPLATGVYTVEPVFTVKTPTQD